MAKLRLSRSYSIFVGLGPIFLRKKVGDIFFLLYLTWLANLFLLYKFKNGYLTIKMHSNSYKIITLHAFYIESVELFSLRDFSTQLENIFLKKYA